MSTIIKLATVEADGVTVFYREAGPSDAPVILLLHGFPSSSFQFRKLIPLLATKYRVVAPDIPGFGFTKVPAGRQYDYKFASFAKTIGAFIDVLNIKSFAVYIFDYGAPTALRLALERPKAITAIITQNGNAYVEGFGADAWAPDSSVLGQQQQGRPGESSQCNVNLRLYKIPVRAWNAYGSTVAGLARDVYARLGAHELKGAARDPAGYIQGLRIQRAAVPAVPGVFPHEQGADSGCLGKK